MDTTMTVDFSQELLQVLRDQSDKHLEGMRAIAKTQDAICKEHRADMQGIKQAITDLTSAVGNMNQQSTRTTKALVRPLIFGIVAMGIILGSIAGSKVLFSSGSITMEADAHAP